MEEQGRKEGASRSREGRWGDGKDREHQVRTTVQVTTKVIAMKA